MRNEPLGNLNEERDRALHDHDTIEGFDDLTTAAPSTSAPQPQPYNDVPRSAAQPQMDWASPPALPTDQQLARADNEQTRMPPRLPRSANEGLSTAEPENVNEPEPSITLRGRDGPPLADDLAIETRIDIDRNDGVAKTKPIASSKSYVFPTLIGFAVGVVFWHFVGFWNFVSEAVFNGPREKIALESISAAKSRSTGTRGVETGSISRETRTNALPPQAALSSSNCQTLAFDAATQRMRLVPCPLGTPPSPISDNGFTNNETQLNHNETSTQSRGSGWQAETRALPQNAETNSHW